MGLRIPEPAQESKNKDKQNKFLNSVWCFCNGLVLLFQVLGYLDFRDSLAKMFYNDDH